MIIGKSFSANLNPYSFLTRFAFSNESVHPVFPISRFGVHETLPIKALNFPIFKIIAVVNLFYFYGKALALPILIWSRYKKRFLFFSIL